jgi:hypothetical protein
MAPATVPYCVPRSDSANAGAVSSMSARAIFKLSAASRHCSCPTQNFRDDGGALWRLPKEAHAAAFHRQGPRIRSASPLARHCPDPHYSGHGSPHGGGLDGIAVDVGRGARRLRDLRLVRDRRHFRARAATLSRPARGCSRVHRRPVHGGRHHLPVDLRGPGKHPRGICARGASDVRALRTVLFLGGALRATSRGARRVLHRGRK